MKIDPSLFVANRAAGAASTARPPQGRFELPAMEAPHAPQASTAARSVAGAGLVAAIAGEADRQARRERRQSHASALLGRLEALMRELSLGRIDSATLQSLGAGLNDSALRSDDPVLESLIDAIELRAAVEIAKLRARKPRF